MPISSKKNIGHSTGNLRFHDKPIEFKLPILDQHPLDDALNEIELMGFSVCDVFELVDPDLNKYLPAKAFQENQNKEVTVLGFLITSKPVHTIKYETKFFHTFIDLAGDWLDSVFFPQAARYHNASGCGFYEMKGKVLRSFRCIP